MKTRLDLLSYDQIGKFSSFDQAYAHNPGQFSDFLAYLPSLDGLDAALAVRAHTPVNRQLLFERVFVQLKLLKADQVAHARAASLLEPDTFTITTAHQPVVFGGPLYIVYKALSAVHLCQQMAVRHPEKNFIPVFVLGAEDHDFDEISQARMFGQTLTWQTDAQGPTGLLPAELFKPLLDQFEALVANRTINQEFAERVRQAFSNHFLYGDAAQQLLHDLFAPLGMLVLQMNDPELKRAFIPALEKELFEQPSAALVEDTQAQIGSLGFKPQAFARPINLFYMKPGLRARMEQTGDTFKVVGTDIEMTAQELKLELYTHPERFSPNVVLRPLYQEWILPNLAYVGGGGELAYWIERKAQFEYFGVPFPVLIRRSSAMWLSGGDAAKMAKLGLDIGRLALPEPQLTKDYLAQLEVNPLDVEEQRVTLQRIADQLAAKASAIDPTLQKTAHAEVNRMELILDQFSQRLNKALKLKHEVSLRQAIATQERLFPAGGLQERTESLSGIMLQYGQGWLEAILPHMDPLDMRFKVISENGHA